MQSQKRQQMSRVITCREGKLQKDCACKFPVITGAVPVKEKINRDSSPCRIQSLGSCWERGLKWCLRPCFCHCGAKGRPGVVDMNGQSGRETCGSSNMLRNEGWSPMVRKMAVLPSWCTWRWKRKRHWYFILLDCKSHVSGFNVFLIARAWR